MHVGYVVLGKCKQVWARQVQAESAQHVTRTNDESDETSAHQRAAQHTAFHPAPFMLCFISHILHTDLSQKKAKVICKR